MRNTKIQNLVVKNVVNQLNLLALYEPLLKTKQIQYFKLYYEKNLSYAEIAKYYKISRAAIGESISQTKQLLKQYEKKLKLYEKHKKRIEMFLKIKDPKLKNELINFENELC